MTKTNETEAVAPTKPIKPVSATVKKISKASFKKAPNVVDHEPQTKEEL